MNDTKINRYYHQRDEIAELLSLFERAAFRPHDKNNGGDPTAVLNAIWETRIALSKRGAVLLEYKEAADFFRQLLDGLWELEKQVQDKYPEVIGLAYEWQGKPINTSERLQAIKNALGDKYSESAMFIRAAASKVYDSPEKAEKLLEKLDFQIENLVKNDPSSQQVVFNHSTVNAPVIIGGHNSTINNTIGDITLAINSIPNVNERDKVTLKRLVQQLIDELQATPPEHKDDAEAIVETTKNLVDAADQEKPNKQLIKISAEGLKSAAQNLGQILPQVITISTSIIKMVFQLTGIPLP